MSKYIVKEIRIQLKSHNQFSYNLYGHTEDSIDIKLVFIGSDARTYRTPDAALDAAISHIVQFPEMYTLKK